MIKKIQIESVDLEKLIPYARNARTHSADQVAQIAASIKEFGFTNPVLIDETGSIIAGHGRVLAARKLGLVEVPTIKLDYLNETQKKAYIIADNKLALNAGWDERMLGLEVKEIEEAGFDLSLMGFSEKELNELLAFADDDDDLETSDDENLPQAIQMEPPREYAVIMCNDSEEWERLKIALNLTPVRRGGYRAGSPFDAVGTQRVVLAANVLPMLEGVAYANSSSK
jgi:ParB-like chromosome segregation protein Spo0J